MNLSPDWKYLLMIYGAVSSGKCNHNLAKNCPGKISHARWLTTANRILRLYISTEDPSNNLLLIVDYIMKVYVPIWFAIRSDSSVTSGGKHFFNMVKRISDLDTCVKGIVNPVMARNGYFGHHENILLSMVFDES